MNKLMLGALLTSTLGFLSVTAQADDNVVRGSLERAAEAGFSELERRVIREYLGEYGIEADRDYDRDRTKGKPGKKGKKGGMPPGLARKDSLPGGLQKQLQKNGTLPPGLAKRALPDGLQSRLPPPPQGYERTIVEDASVVLVEKATGRIADIITDVVMGE